jgi:hypothetical protein
LGSGESKRNTVELGRLDGKDRTQNNLKIGRFGKSVLPIKTAFLNLNRFSKIIKKNKSSIEPTTNIPMGRF